MNDWLAPIHNALDDWDEDDTYIKIESVLNRDDGLDIGVLVWRSVGDQRRWIIECREVVDCRIHCEVSDWIQHEASGPLLVPYIESQAELYFRGTPRDFSSLAGDLLVAHHSILDARFPIAAFVRGGSHRPNRPTSCVLTPSFFDVGFGLIAKGPRSLILAYQEVIERHGLHTSILPSVRVNHAESTEPNFDSGISALIFDESFVIARRFRIM